MVAKVVAVSQTFGISIGRANAIIMLSFVIAIVLTAVFSIGVATFGYVTPHHIGFHQARRQAIVQPNLVCTLRRNDVGMAAISRRHTHVSEVPSEMVSYRHRANARRGRTTVGSSTMVRS